MGDSIGISGEQTNIARAVIYRFLSRCFSHPDRDLIELFDGARLEEILQARRCLGLEKPQDIEEAANWLAKWPSQETALLELGREYTGLFINAYPKVIAPPYSSLYLDSDKLVWGRSTAGVARLYEAAGLSISREYHDIPDHIGAELEFASYLIAGQLKNDAHRASPAEQLACLEKRLLAEHLHRWAPAFFNLVVESASAGFYQAAALMGRQFIERDMSHLVVHAQGRTEPCS